jgi:hypothetical protein
MTNLEAKMEIHRLLCALNYAAGWLNASEDERCNKLGAKLDEVIEHGKHINIEDT